MSECPKTDPAELAEFCMKCAGEKLAEDVVKLDVGANSSIADYFVIATANSDPQLQAMAGFIERQVREKYGRRPLSESGDSQSGWLLLDFGAVIIHLMTPETRSRYNLEGLWGEAAAHVAAARH